MHRSGATLRKTTDGTLQAVALRARAWFDKVSAEKSKPSLATPHLTEIAMRALRLEQQPFAPPRGPQSYYADQLIDGMLGALEESLLQGNNLVVLSGERNSGKTCSVAQLVHALFEQAQLFVARGSASQSAEQIVRGMLGNFRSTTPTHVDDCLELLTDYLAEGDSRATQNLLVLEDAELLDRRELQLLLNHLDHLNDSLSGTLKLLFTSSAPAEQLFTGLRSDQLDQGRVEEFCQPLLGEAQVAEYIDARLLMAGSDEELPLDERSLDRIAADTAGLPGEVDLAAAQALNQHYKNRQLKALLSPAHWRAASRQSSKRLAIGGTLLLSGLAMAFFSSAGSVERSGTTVREIAVAAPQPQELQLVPPAAEPTPGTPRADAGQTPSSATERNAAAPEPKPAAAPRPAPETVVAATKPAASTAAAATAATPTPAAKPAVEATPTTAAKPAPKPAPRPTPAPETSDDFIAGVISGHQWINRRDPARFTAQMSAGWNERDLRLFATRNGMTNKTAIYRTVRDGKGWYSLVYGDFASPAEARRAIAKLPAVWRKNEPWIRSFATVQKAIK